jgi:hypothetical protein
MATLRWNDPGTRTFETGVDRGVIFLEEGYGVAWSGITAVNKKFDRDLEAVYYDGVKVSEIATLGEYAGTIRAFMYPVEMERAEGTGYLKCGATIGEQAPRRFALSYRTLVGNDLDQDAGYKLHIVYNLLATPADRDHATIEDSLEPIEFEWDVVALAEDIPGFRPSAEITIDSTKTDMMLLEQIEEILYGSIAVDPRLPTVQELVAMINDWARLTIVDNGDGTWTGTDYFDQLRILTYPDSPDYCVISAQSLFNFEDLTPGVENDMFVVSDLTCVTEESMTIRITDLGYIWQADYEYEQQVLIDEETGWFVINDATIIEAGPDMYIITDTV